MSFKPSSHSTQAFTFEVSSTELRGCDVHEFRSALEREDSPEMVVLDCSRVLAVTQNAIEELAKISGLLAQERKNLVLIAGREILDAIESSGVRGFARTVVEFSGLQEVREAEVSGRAASELLDAFAQGVVQALEAYASDRPLIQGAGEEGVFPSVPVDVAGSVEFATRDVSGFLFLTFPEETFLKLASRIMGEQVTGLTPEVTDWAAELLNQASSMAKETLNRRDQGFTLALPCVVPSGAIGLMRPPSMSVRVLSFQGQAGPFFLEVFTMPLS